MARIALYQARSGIDPAANSVALVAAVETAAAGGAEMLFTPEMSGLLDSNRERAKSAIRTEQDDEVLRSVRAAAKASGIWVHLGSLALQGPGDRFVNRAFLMDNEGEVRARYDKIHLFDVDLQTGESWRESAVYQGGDRPVLVRDTPVGNLGLTICYDLRFPALFERLSEAGAEVIAVPAAFTVPTGKAHWHVLLRARAIEAGLFVLAAAQGGRHEDGRETYGHSLVIDPWGEVLLDAADQGGVHFAEIDLGRIAEVRSRVPALKHRKAIGPVD
ncbi:carbon-nitrogen hydrolase family protein [Sphingomonas alba]|uniref:Carbon-nitrogen hydrolase family protein n=1 Tax=Sphingomonas alba TaxID=2908208 RepID=A0ABT0RP13_9SPHN|nr:carbon-nitrogen hydrolase family protein [Sphingomonas alba]MCL6684313.1 carbon-nitrogen hydrolase family protein [Sphingomonas alba]